MNKRSSFSKNQVLQVTIQDMTREGTGVAHVDGYTIFVPSAITGEKVEILLIKVKSNYAIAKILKILTPSASRIEPFCPYYEQCGGCSLQHLDYQQQLKIKSHDVHEVLARIGGIELAEDPEILGMDEPWLYRNKAQFPVQMINGTMVSGFYAPRSHRLIPVKRCLIQGDRSNELVSRIVEFCNIKKIQAYDEITHKGLLRHILVRTGAEDEVLVCLVVTSWKLPYQNELVNMLTKLGVTSISLNLNAQNSNVILGPENRCIGGKAKINAAIGPMKFRISAPSFFQVNSIQTEKLYQSALEFADLHGSENVWDAYCGAGTISLFLAQKAGSVNGVEIVEPAVQDAWENAALNQIDNVTFYAGKAEEVIPQQFSQTGEHPDVIVVDPPRAGCEEVLLETIHKMAPKRFVYVSCDPATLARDLKYMTQKGWQLQKIRCVDMFPQTGHVETVVLLSKKYVNQKEYVEIGVDAEDYYKIKYNNESKFGI